ncbi:hypothetical protein V5P93_001269 [Actinokineospora auranticolor]|uniref:LPXTG-motif cell wall-anchored protein n=1 Tax=Actinokineospora auranticolor TaxID=155976 RepID=A0A2S6GUM7_9PSEU|nr:hypothetical protein [Actinokineospora auranticolor]PPK68897.1 hypothetical protein CLV40_104141 [Actinokineospora auranticolor]
MLLRNLAVVAAAAGALAITLPGTASADRVGGLLITPGESVDQVPVRLKTEKGCPAGTTGYFATMTGHGLDNVVVVPASDVSMSLTDGFVVPVAYTFRDYAQDNKTTLSGRYQVALHCVDAFTQQEFGTFTAEVDFPEPSRYAAVGPAKGPARNTEPIMPPELGLAEQPGVAPPVEGGTGAGQPQPARQPPAGQPSTPNDPSNSSDVDTSTQAAPESSSKLFYYVAGGVAVVVLGAGIAVARSRGTRTESDSE